MTDEVQGAITSDKVETDGRDFATVKADQTCEEVLIPGENAFRQLNWRVTLEKGSVYNPSDEIGIYAEEVDCKYGVQIKGDVFGRNTVQLEYGGATHSEGDANSIGTRVFGSVISEGQVEVVDPEAEMDDLTDRPVTIYGDVTGSHVTFDRPTIVYGCVKAEQAFRTNAPSVVIGNVQSNGLVEASDLFTYSLIARDDVTLGDRVAVANPMIWSREGTIEIADRIGLFLPEIFEQIRESNDVEAIGPWILDVDAIWENTLQPVDVIDHDEGQITDRGWRTVAVPERTYEKSRELFEEMIEATRKSPPDIEEFRYAGLGSLADLGGTSIEGDVVIGAQKKEVEETDVTEVDQSTTIVDQSTEVHDERTTVEDSVVNRSDIGDEADSQESEGENESE